jgi:hypothetical protein
MVTPASVAWNSLRREPFGVVDLILSFVSPSKLARLFISFTVINLFIYIRVIRPQVIEKLKGKTNGKYKLALEEVDLMSSI